MTKAVAIAVLAVCMSINPAMAQVNMSQVVGPQVSGDNTQTRLRADREGSQVVTDAHGRYNEPTRRGTVMILNSDSVTLAAAHVTKSALGTIKFINGIYNPVGSNKAASILRAFVSDVSGANGGPFFLDYYCGVTLTNANTGTIRSGLLSNNSSSSAMAPEVNVAIVVSGAATTAVNQLWEVTSSSFTGIGPQYGINVPDDVQGMIVVPPGCIFGLTATAAAGVVQSTLVWDEIAYP